MQLVVVLVAVEHLIKETMVDLEAVVEQEIKVLKDQVLQLNRLNLETLVLMDLEIMVVKVVVALVELVLVEVLEVQEDKVETLVLV
jgi:hypothetical protein